MKDLPSTQSTLNELHEECTCIYCRVGIAKLTKEGLYYCKFCGRHQQRGFSMYKILPRRF